MKSKIFKNITKKQVLIVSFAFIILLGSVITISIFNNKTLTNKNRVNNNNNKKESNRYNLIELSDLELFTTNNEDKTYLDGFSIISTFNEKIPTIDDGDFSIQYSEKTSEGIDNYEYKCSKNSTDCNIEKINDSQIKFNFRKVNSNRANYIFVINAIISENRYISKTLYFTFDMIDDYTDPENIPKLNNVFTLTYPGIDTENDKYILYSLTARITPKYGVELHPKLKIYKNNEFHAEYSNLYYSNHDYSEYEDYYFEFNIPKKVGVYKIYASDTDNAMSFISDTKTINVEPTGDIITEIDNNTIDLDINDTFQLNPQYSNCNNDSKEFLYVVKEGENVIDVDDTVKIYPQQVGSAVVAINSKDTYNGSPAWTKNVNVRITNSILTNKPEKPKLMVDNINGWITDNKINYDSYVTIEIYDTKVFDPENDRNIKIEYNLDNRGWADATDEYMSSSVPGKGNLQIDLIDIIGNKKHTIKVRYKNSDGTIISPESDELNFSYGTDNDAPIITNIIAKDDSNNTYNGNLTNSKVKISIEAYDELSGIGKYQYSYDKNVWNDFDNNECSFRDINKVVYFRVIDNAGNSSSGLRTLKINSDTIAPSLTLKVNNIEISNETTNNYNNEITLSASSDEDAKYKFEVKKDKETTNYATPNIKLSKSGNYTIKVTATDNAGNTTEKTYAININISTTDESKYKLIEDTENEKNKYIINVDPNTTVAKFKEEFNKLNIGNIDNIEIKDGKSEEEQNSTSTLIRTGDYFKISNTTYTVLIAGDTNADGYVTVSDITGCVYKANNNVKDARYYACQLDASHNLLLDKNKPITISDIARIVYYVNTMIEGGI